MKLGYACINLSLIDIRANRTMIKKTFDNKGLSYVSELVLQNCDGLQKIVEWNVKNNIYAYRLPDDLFPWKSHYNLNDLPNIDIITKKLISIGNYCRQHNHRLSFHPGPYNILASDKQNVIDNTIIELNQFSKIFDLMQYDANHLTKINVHVGGAYGDKQSALNRFCENFQKLDSNLQKRLTVENDDKPNMYTVQDLYYLYQQINIPIVFDNHHFQIKNDGYQHKETLDLALSTWNVEPVIHHSSSKKIYENESGIEKIQSHCDYLYEKCETYNYDLVIMLECKMKDIALIKYRNEFL